MEQSSILRMRFATRLLCASRGEDLGVGVRAAPAGSSSRDGRITQARVGGRPRTKR